MAVGGSLELRSLLVQPGNGSDFGTAAQGTVLLSDVKRVGLLHE